MDRPKRILTALLVLGALVTLGVGTYATFTAQTTNPNNTYTTGTLILSDTVTTTCYSAGASATIANNNVNASCDSVNFASLGAPGVPSTPAQLTLTNAGTIAGTNGLAVSSSSCSDTAAGAYHGDPSGNPLCAALNVQIQDYTDSTFSTPVASHCVYPASSSAVCGSSYGALAGLSGASVKAPMAAGSSAYLKVTFSLPAATGNAVQGLQSRFNLDWVLTQ